MKYFLSGILEEICDQVDEKGIEGAYGYIVGNLLPDFLLCFVGVGELNMAAKASKATEAAEKTRSTKWGRGAAAGAKTSGEAAKLRGFGRFGELIADFGEWNKLPVFVTPEGFTMKGDAAGRFFADFKEFRQVKNAERMAAVDDIARLKPQNLMDELAMSGVKYTPDDVLMVTKTPDGKLMWLEKGHAKSGLEHITQRHAKNFADRGVDNIPEFLNRTLKEKPINIGRTHDGPFADYLIDGKKYRLVHGDNGYIVSFYPIK